ncbi:LuxR family transcriptional regulator [Cryobacterium sp. TMT1-2-2]|nr:LuxR family transcriptional regulator [Cryobacterium sp. TMT1-2-2]
MGTAHHDPLTPSILIRQHPAEVPRNRPALTGDASSPVPDPRPDFTDWDSIATLSSREREIFLLAARGLSNSDIAHSAHIGESTVKTHLSSILTKLGFTSRAQIVAHAYQSGLSH